MDRVEDTHQDICLRCGASLEHPIHPTPLAFLQIKTLYCDDCTKMVLFERRHLVPCPYKTHWRPKA